MRGQYFSFDAIIGSVIFILALVALLSYWYSVRSFLDFQNDPLSKDAIAVSNLLFTPPSPDSSCGTMEKLGFAKNWNDRRVDASILACAGSKDQQWLKSSLGTQFNLSINVTNKANDSSFLIGGDVPASALNVVKIRRLATVLESDGHTYLASIDLSMYR